MVFGLFEGNKIDIQVDKPNYKFGEEVTGKIILDMTKNEVLTKMKRLPVEKICGIGEKFKRRLNVLGIFSCGDFAEFPADILKKHFGVVGMWMKMMCLVDDVSTVGFYADREAPPRYRDAGRRGSLAECSEYIEEVWTDMRPLSVRRRLAE